MTANNPATDIDALLASEFPVTQHLNYLNHAAVAPWPKRTAAAVHVFADECVNEGSSHFMDWLELENALRERLAAFTGASSANDIAFLKNTSEGLSVVAHGFPWQPGDNVVISDEEFPSNRIVWESLERFGVEVRQVSLRSGKSPEDALLSSFDGKTRILAISAVQYVSGLRMDLERLGSECKKRDIAFCVDAIQALGAIKIDLQAMHIDFLAADAHKWLLGPEGIAVFYCSEKWRDRLALHQYGWHMIEHHFDFDTKVWEPAASARRFECGSNNMLGIQALSASLSLLEEIGMKEVENRVVANAESLVELIDSRDTLELITNPSPGRLAGIVTFKSKIVPTEVLHSVLTGSGVVCAMRGGGVRFSPHCYIRGEKLAAAVETAASVTK
ncbi:MAG: aminotransferase class V-fold PLP-dependent enzyme [Acidiferrobacterales bacterium]|nr:aminotransferase class V-fold PLP-dependent enzyme [Acidiferrobacterales bacterium]